MEYEVQVVLEGLSKLQNNNNITQVTNEHVYIYNCEVSYAGLVLLQQ